MVVGQIDSVPVNSFETLGVDEKMLKCDSLDQFNFSLFAE